MPKRSIPETAAAKRFGSILRGLRTKQRLTARDVGEIVDLKTDTILKYERGQREPSILTLIQFSHLYRVPIDLLITGRGKPLSTTEYAPWEEIGNIVVVTGVDDEITYVGPNRRSRRRRPHKGPERRAGK